jgi:hypothetical protein
MDCGCGLSVVFLSPAALCVAAETGFTEGGEDKMAPRIFRIADFELDRSVNALRRNAHRWAAVRQVSGSGLGFGPQNPAAAANRPTRRPKMLIPMTVSSSWPPSWELAKEA